MSGFKTVRRILYFLTAIPVFLLLICLFLFKKDIPLEDLKEKYTNENSKFLDVSDMSVHYRDEGNGEAFVLLHGTGASIHTWDDWADELKKDYRVIRMDLPAFGLTGPHPLRDYSIDFYARFVMSFLNQLGIDSFALVGNSLGGRIAWQIAAKNPEKLTSLVLIDAAGFPTPKTKLFEMAQKPLTRFLIKKIIPRKLIAKNLKAVYFDDTKVNDRLIDRYWLMARREGNRQAFIDRANTAFFDESELLKQIKCPTLIMWGKQDEWIPLSHAYEFSALIPNTQLALVENAGHIPMEEKPKETLQFLRQFLEKLADH